MYSATCLNHDTYTFSMVKILRSFPALGCHKYRSCEHSLACLPGCGICMPAFLLGISPQVKFCFRRSCQTSLFYLYTFYIHLFFEFSLQHFDVDISSPLTDEKTRAQKDTVSSQGHRASEQQGQGMNLDLSGSAVCIFSIT